MAQKVIWHPHMAPSCLVFTHYKLEDFKIKADR